MSSPFTNRVKILFILIFLAASPVLADVKVLPLVATVEEVEGSPKITRFEKTVEMKAGDFISSGDQLQTGREDRVLLQFAFDGTLVKLAGETEIEIPGKPGTQIFLKKGLLWGRKTTKDSSFLIQTSVMVTAVRGTEFFVQVKDAEQAMVLTQEGTVEVQFEGVTYQVGPMKLGFFQKGQGSRLGPAQERILADWEASFKKKDSLAT